MSKVVNDPKNGAQKVTNTDEQEVAVNHSTVQEGGYDEPVNQQDEEQVSKQEEKAPAERSRPRQPQEGKRAHRPYHDEETE